MQKKPIHVRVPADVYERYLKLAKDTERTMSFYVVRAMQSSMATLEREYGKKRGGKR